MPTRENGSMTDRNDLIRRGCVGVLTCLLVTLLAGANGERPAYAAPQAPPPTFTVNSTSDVVASAPLDNGICETAPHNNTCTLRAAIMKANHWAGGGVTIILPALTGGAEYMLTIPPVGSNDDEASGDLSITNTMTIIGGGAANTVIDGSELTPTRRVLFIGHGGIATISGVTVQGGNSGVGGNGGGILDSDSLTLHDSIVTRNTTSGGGFGGGIFNQSSALTVTDSIVSHNTTPNLGAGVVGDGGVTTLRRVTVSSNTAGYGGGVYATDSLSFDIVDSTISNNEATNNGGGIFHDGHGLAVVNSTISDNEAINNGGGIYNAGPSLAIINSTISDNFSDRNGAGIFNDHYSACCTVSFYNATIVGNQANQAVIGGTGGGIFNTSGSTVALQNTLLAGNVRSTGGPDVFDDCSGTVTANSYNLFSSAAGCDGIGPLDLKNKPGLTGPLQNNGGPTFTNALLPGSPAIDAGNPNLGGCADNLGATLHTDQRGAPRPANGAGSTVCDIGAYELQRTLSLPLVLK